MTPIAQQLSQFMDPSLAQQIAALATMAATMIQMDDEIRALKAEKESSDDTAREAEAT